MNETTYKLVNSRGRTLLEVTSASMVEYQGAPCVFYSYKGDGCGGYGPIDSLNAMVRTIQADAPSARIVGQLPTP